MSLRGCSCLQSASQTVDPIEDATKAARPSVLLVCACVFGSADCPLPAGAGRAAAEDRSGERGSSQDGKKMCSANTAGISRESTPAPGRIWNNESEDWPSKRWKQHSKLSKP